MTKVAVQTLRRIAGPDSKIEGRLRRAFTPNLIKKETGDKFVQRASDQWVFVESKKESGPKVGVFMKGSCDLPSMFLLAPRVREEFKGQLAIFRQGIGVSDSRPDILLQSHKHIADEVIDKTFAGQGQFFVKKLGPAYFRPALFHPTFELPKLPSAGTFSKNLVVLSVAASISRTGYRHRETGIVIDPGGFWLNQSMQTVLKDLQVATWFKESFENIGRLTAEEFFDVFGEVVRLVQAETGAAVLVYNTLLVDPGNSLHNYQFARNPQTIRRREFDLALRELAQKLDFHIMDIDRILKIAGTKEQVDFAHMPNERMLPIADEAYRIMQDLELL
jgi:hypothetical protein